MAYPAIRCADDAVRDESGLYANLFCLGGAALAAFLIFRHLGGGSIDWFDEALSGGRSLSFYHSHDPLRLTMNGELSLRKPPLVYMLNALSFAVFGINEFGLRFFNALFGFLTFLLIGLFADRLCGRVYAAVAMLLLCGASLFIDYCRMALTDTAFIFGVVLASLAVARSLSSGHVTTAQRAAFAGGVFIAACGKGLLVLIVPLYAVIFLGFGRRGVLARFVAPTLVGLLPLALWLLAELSTQPSFLHDFFGQEVYERLNPNSTYLPAQLHGYFWYLQKLWDWFGIAGHIGLVSAIAWVTVHIRSRATGRAVPVRAEVAYLAGFALFFTLMLSLSSHKREGYILPLFPVLCVVIAASLALLHARAHRARKVWRTYLGFVALAIVVGDVRSLITTREIPDYRPEAKQLALQLRAEGAALPAIVTDDEQIARVLHFYLDRTITVVPAPVWDRVDESPALLISRQPRVQARRVGAYYLAGGRGNG